MKALIINGPNLNLLGKREPGIYGSTPFESYLENLRSNYPNVEIGYSQSNVEGEIITALQNADESYNGILLNAGGYTHTSVAIGDAIKAISTPVIEIHISNVLAREDFRKISHISAQCKGTISGFGTDSYRLGLEALLFNSENLLTPRT